ncbi:hypothetical protein [Defluviimonas salinarum]|uniref:Uncharacterized protein n=1 Tax=Defluviimonas salinarum TaxID=2992147 RepID=A0ABT3J8A3_9RHOB|nr:hypothetical protein [Defluviimonas salinarum]MCW3783923.1 hypothetical protein [Defluviimonas salinarum]
MAHPCRDRIGREVNRGDRMPATRRGIALALGLTALGIAAMGAASGIIRGRRPTSLEAMAGRDVFLAPDDPVQGLALREQEPILINGYELRQIASFDIKAVVLSRKDYSGGRESDLSPTDLALGWGMMSNPVLIDKVTITQSGRWYRWQPPRAAVTTTDIIRNSSNMHIIPADGGVAVALGQVQRGDVIEISGHLVDVRGAAWSWSSSRRRDDIGDGACEIVLARRLEIV